MQISDRVFVITGASEGLGAAMARALYERGARLSLNALSAHPVSLVEEGREVWTVGDIAHPQTRQSLFERTMERFGAVDVLINNAGVGVYEEAWRCSEQDLRRMFDVNVFAPLAMIQLVVPQMIQRRAGAIVNICSVASRVALPWATGYCASKAAGAAMSDGVRRELRSWGIHVMTVYPGIMRTRFRANVLRGTPPARVLTMRHSISAERAAEAVLRGIERRSRTVVVPRTGLLLMVADLLVAPVVDRFLAYFSDRP